MALPPPDLGLDDDAFEEITEFSHGMFEPGSDNGQLLEKLRSAALHASNNEEARHMTAQIAALTRVYRVKNNIGLPLGPGEQGVELDERFILRPHISYLSDRLGDVVRAVERGQNQMLAVSMPPRAGKSTLISYHLVLWLLRRHPEWKIVLSSHDGGLAGLWARAVRRTIEEYPRLGVMIERDGGATTEWSTIEGGGVLARGIRSSLTGRGARVILIDDPVKDFVEAHSVNMRQSVWDWWLSVAQTRLEPPYLVVVVMTRWHQDDMIGRLFSTDHEGDPRDWQRISLPAIAEKDDQLGRLPGEPLLSPIIEESPLQASARWSEIRRNVGTYTFSAMYQQRPAPEQGAIFDSAWWRFWSFDPAKATEDGRVLHLDPSALLGGRWIDSWDCSFKGVSDADFVVGQRWVREGANRFLITSKRGRWSFTKALHEMRVWGRSDDPVASPCGHLVHERVVEDTANGPAIIDTLKNEIAGIIPVSKKFSKEAYARAITPECESGNVYLPHPSDPGNEWVTDLLSELRDFPHGADDDQVDTFTQALARLRGPGKGRVTVPGALAAQRGALPIDRNLPRAAASDVERRRPRTRVVRPPGR